MSQMGIFSGIIGLPLAPVRGMIVGPVRGVMALSVVPLPGVQRHVLGFAAQKVLTQRRPCVGQRGIRGEDLYGQLAVVGAKRFGGTDTGGSAADDDQSGLSH